MMDIAMKKTTDLTEGPIIRQLLLFFLPIAAGSVFQQLYNAVDALVVSRFVGTAALAAVGGSAARVVDLLIGFCVALASGAAVVIAQFYGARRYEEVRRSIHTSYLFCALLGLSLTVIVFVLTKPLLTLLKTPEDTFADAAVYLRIIFGGAVFTLLYNMGASALRALGNSRFPFLCLALCCVLNSVLDIVFVAGLRLGVTGAAWATVFSQAVSAVLVTGALLRSDAAVRFSFRELRLTGNVLLRMMKIGVPAGLQSLMYSISNVILQVGINLLGTVVIASWSMSGKVDGFFWVVSNAFATAVCTFVGQNYGAGKLDRVRDSVRRGFFVLFGMTLAMIVIILLLARPILRIFTTDPAVIDCTRYIIFFFVPTYVLWIIIDHFSGAMRGLGDTLVPTIITGVCICGFRILWVLTAFRISPTLPVICAGYPLSWLLGDIGILIHYKRLPVFRKKQSGI